MKKLVIMLLIPVLSVFTACSAGSGETSSVDYGSYFGEREGCAVFYDASEDKTEVYNEEMANTRFSPNSTFKIISTLAGLKYGVLKDENSHMSYNGGDYPIDSWESDLNLKEAFQNSCVWYFRQVIDGVGQENMQKDIDNLNYGNRDISMWQGSGEAPTPDTNGFWLGSSLEISPLEMTHIIADIFEDRTDYDSSHIDILKDIMQSDIPDIYGKTGAGRDNSAWYSGFYENNGKKIYFAVHMEGGDILTAGADAKETACRIIGDRLSSADN